MHILYNGTISFLGVHPRPYVEYVLENTCRKMFTRAVCLIERRKKRINLDVKKCYIETLKQSIKANFNNLI